MLLLLAPRMPLAAALEWAFLLCVAVQKPLERRRSCLWQAPPAPPPPPPPCLLITLTLSTKMEAVASLLASIQTETLSLLIRPPPKTRHSAWEEEGPLTKLVSPTLFPFNTATLTAA